MHIDAFEKKFNRLKEDIYNSLEELESLIGRYMDEYDDNAEIEEND